MGLGLRARSGKAGCVARKPSPGLGKGNFDPKPGDGRPKLKVGDWRPGLRPKAWKGALGGREKKTVGETQTPGPGASGLAGGWGASVFATLRRPR